LAQDRNALANSVGKSIRLFLDAGIKVAVVHGGGPQATLLSTRLGIETKQVGGRRITDEATLEVMKMSLAGQVSVDVASSMTKAGVPALCTTGVSAGLVVATRRPSKVVAGGGPEPVDFGLVGDVASVNAEMLEGLARAKVVPVLGCLCADLNGEPLNVNADTVATKVAGALKAAKLLLVSNVPGVLQDKNNPATRIPRLTPSQATDYILQGVISGGMIPKVEESLEMLTQGIGAIHIVGIVPDDALLQEAMSPGSVGTAFFKSAV
jgi:acetylglutamate kinase